MERGREGVVVEGCERGGECATVYHQRDVSQQLVVSYLHNGEGSGEVSPDVHEIQCTEVTGSLAWQGIGTER